MILKKLNKILLIGLNKVTKMCIIIVIRIMLKKKVLRLDKGDINGIY